MSDPIPAAAIETVRAFFRHAVDEADAAKAKTLLCKASVAAGSFQLPPGADKAKYVLGDPTFADGQIWVPVHLTDGTTGQSMTLPFAPVQEDGAWKLDMEKMMEKLMGTTLGQVAEQMGQALGAAMQGVGDALSSAFGGEAPADPPKGTPAALEKFTKEELPRITEQTARSTDLDIPIDVDLPSLLRGEDEQTNARLLEAITDKVLQNWHYAVGEANRVFPLADRVKGLRLEGARSASDHVLFAEGARIIYRINLVEEEGFYDGQRLAELLTGVVAGMAETALPGDPRTGPSYQPTGDAAAITKSYREFVEPVLMGRIHEMFGREMPLEIDWDNVAYSEDTAKGMWAWGLNRICGALALLMARPGVKEPLIELLTGIRFFVMTDPYHKAIRVERQTGLELWLYVSPSDGEKGCFYEDEIANELSAKLKLRTAPVIRELEKYAKNWEEDLLQLFKRPIKYAFDWDGFTCQDDENKNAFALTLLREHGIDRMYYALTSLAEKNPNFKQQLPQRVMWIYLEHTPRAESKSISGEQTTLRYRLFLHEGYAGYLTQKDLEKALPGIVAKMPDIQFDTPALDENSDHGEPTSPPDSGSHSSHGVPEPKAQTESEPDAELTEFAELQAEEAKRAAQVEVDFAQARAQMDATCESMGQQIAMFLGKAIPLALDWASIPKAVEAAGDLLNHGLSPVLGGLAVLSQSPPDRAAAVEKVGAIVLRAAEKPAAQGFSMEDATLVFSTCLGARTPVMDPQTAAGLLTKTLASKVTGTKSNAPKKPPAKPTPAKTAAKRASSAAARPKAPKPAAKTKPAAKEKPAPKKKKK